MLSVAQEGQRSIRMDRNGCIFPVSYTHLDVYKRQGLTLSGTTNIAQTMRDSSIAVTLPDLNITLSRLFPFKRKKAACLLYTSGL